MQLEHSWRKNIEHKRQLLEQAPVKNWEKIAREGAANIQQAWNQSTGMLFWDLKVVAVHRMPFSEDELIIFNLFAKSKQTNKYI